MNNDIQTLAITLQTALHRQTPSIRLSRAASLAESGFIWPVAQSLRCACLLSALTASESTLIALHDALKHTDGIAIAVHEPSQQIFIINRALLSKRWSDANRWDLFYSIDVDDREEQERLQTEMPTHLNTLLSELHEKLKSRTTARSTEIIVLDSVKGTMHGIALAGWLLEYDVVYFKAGREEGPSRNNLAGTPLLLVIVRLNNQSLYQYTFPLSIQSDLSSSMAIKGSGIQEICQAIKMRLIDRSLQSAVPDCTFEVIFQHITMDRVAL